MDVSDGEVLSLRTTVAQQSCAILQELAEHLGSSLDPFVDSILPVLGRMAYVDSCSSEFTADKQGFDKEDYS